MATTSCFLASSSSFRNPIIWKEIRGGELTYFEYANSKNIIGIIGNLSYLMYICQVAISYMWVNLSLDFMSSSVYASLGVGSGIGFDRFSGRSDAGSLGIGTNLLVVVVLLVVLALLLLVLVVYSSSL